MADLRGRSNLPELMDQADAKPEEIITALQELEFINTWLGGYKPVLHALRNIKQDKYSILDVGSGGGDVLRRIARDKKLISRVTQMTGVDKNQFMTDYATDASRHITSLSFITADAFELNRLPLKSDIIISTLFCHHFDDQELIRLISVMKNSCNRGFIINDLHRHWFAYHSIRILTALFSNSRLVKYDAPLSVARALTRREWKYILSNAGVEDYSIRWFWAWRWQIIFLKK